MRFSNVRLLVKDYKKCFNFYAGQLGLEPAWGDENSGYASFKVADGIEGFALFVSDWMAPSVGNADKELPVGFREKSLVSFSVDNVDNTYMTLKDKGVIFVNEPTDMADWGARTVHLRDPEDNLIELFSPLAPEQYSEELIEENKKKFCTDWVTTIEGAAPDVLNKLEKPTHVFIGGTSGNLKAILKAVRDRNPEVTIVLNAITLETIKEIMEATDERLLLNPEIIQVCVSKAKTLGQYHMMLGQNPIYVVSFELD